MRILRLACEQFRSYLKNTFQQIEPFSSITMPSYCNKVFRQLYLKKDTFPVLPVQGLLNRKMQSPIAYLWLDTEQEKMKTIIQTAGNGFEAKVGPYWVDGYYCIIDKDNQITKHVVYEFFGKINILYMFIYIQFLFFSGCYHHYHTCKRNIESKMHTLNMQKYEKTKTRIEYFQNRENTELHMIWECEFHKQRKNTTKRPELDKLWKDIRIRLQHEPLKPRDALRGGRTEVFTCAKEITTPSTQSINYVDFVSLYPSTMLCTGMFIIRFFGKIKVFFRRLSNMARWMANNLLVQIPTGTGIISSFSR